eukprot:6214651-Pleurochrysis_carterae.AAC.2
MTFASSNFMLALLFLPPARSVQCQMLITDAHFGDGSNAMSCVDGIGCETTTSIMRAKLSISSVSMQLIVSHKNGTLIANSLMVAVPLPNGKTHTCDLHRVERGWTMYTCLPPGPVGVRE